MEFNLSDFVEIGKLSVSQKIISTSKLVDGLKNTGVKKLSVDTATGAHSIEKEYSPLSVVTVDADTYINHIQDTSKELSDTLYLVESDHLNAYNKRIVNTADPVNGTDAANKSYVDAVLDAGTYSHTCNNSYDLTSQSNNIIYGEFAFDAPLFQNLPEMFFLKTISIKSRQGTGMQKIYAGSKVQIVDGTGATILGVSKPITSTFENLAVATFEFETKILILKGVKYIVKLVDSENNNKQSGVQIGGTDVVSDSGVTYKTFYYDGSNWGNWNRYFGVTSIGISLPFYSCGGIVMTDAEDSTKRYLVKVKNGEFVITTLS